MRGRFVIAATTVLAAAAVASGQPDGDRLYDRYCAQCHGDDGAGRGPAASRLVPEPRDFTSRKFKIRSTPSGALPTDADLARIIRDGMPGTTMPPWPNLSRAEVDALVAKVRSFAGGEEAWASRPEPIEISDPPSMSDESIERGRDIFVEFGCPSCHGDQGRGDGTSGPTLRHDSGQYLRPADLTQPWNFRGGPGRRDVYRAFTTGLNGTPMPSYAESMTDEQRWDLVDYVASLGDGRKAPQGGVVRMTRVERALELEDGDLFADAPWARFPVFGQVIQPGRAFNPGVNEIRVRAVANAADVAFELRWNDMRAEADGSNAPDLEVPRFEDDPHAGAAESEAPSGDDVWGDAAADDPWGGAAMDDDASGSVWGDAAMEEETAGDVWGDAEVDEGGGGDFWGEGTASASLPPDREFSDAVAIQFPASMPRGAKKPYFLFGSSDLPVHLWYRDLGSDAAELWEGRGSSELSSLGPRDLESTASYEDGEWVVRFRRPLRARGEISFDEGVFVPIAFTVWDGFHRERGNRRGLTAWFDARLEPPMPDSPAPSMARAALGVLFLEILAIVWVRRKYPGGWNV